MTTQATSQLDELARQVRELRDVEEIRLLIARYHAASDGTLATGTHRDPQAIADLFTPDGVWNVPGGPFTGPTEILAKARELQSIPSIVHVPVVHMLTVDGDVARGEFKCVAASRRSPTSPPSWSIGTYHTVAVRTPQGWRLQELSWEHLVKHDPPI